LRDVSRAFYLSLRILPADLRRPVGVAYLLARAADTLADTRALPPEERLRRLLDFRAQVAGPTRRETLAEISDAVVAKQTGAPERALLRSLPAIFDLLEALDEEDRQRVRGIVETLTRGMELDLRTFPPEDAGRRAALRDAQELDRYTYLVAGCVGEFWTETIAAHTPALRSWDVARMSALGVRFGKALQLTNILRDCPRDLRIGRCYLPADELAREGLTADDLLVPEAGARAAPLLAARLGEAVEHYRAAEEYVLAIPRRCVRLRLAALWPVLIGLATLAKLASDGRWLESERPCKVTRAWVYRMMVCSLLAVGSNTALRLWMASWRGRLERAAQLTPRR